MSVRGGCTLRCYSRIVAVAEIASGLHQVLCIPIKRVFLLVVNCWNRRFPSYVIEQHKSDVGAVKLPAGFLFDKDFITWMCLPKKTPAKAAATLIY